MTEKPVKLVYGLPCRDDSDESSDESCEELCQGEPHDVERRNPAQMPTRPREEEETSIEKPAKKKGRPPLSDAQKEILRLGREKSRRNQAKRMAQEKLAKIEQEETNETNVAVNKKKSKKQVIVETQPDETSEEEIIYVSKCKKKKKPRKKIIVESSSEDETTTDDEYEEPRVKKTTRKTPVVKLPPIQKPVNRHGVPPEAPQRRLIFR